MTQFKLATWMCEKILNGEFLTLPGVKKKESGKIVILADRLEINTSKDNCTIKQYYQGKLLSTMYIDNYSPGDTINLIGIDLRSKIIVRP